MKNKEQAQMLRESERNLSMTLKSIGDAVIATDTEGRIVRMNTVAEQLTGWNMGEALGRPLDEVFHIINQHTRQRVENPVAKVLQTGKTHGLANDTVLVSRQGTEYVIADSVAAIVDDKTGQTVGVVLVFRDVTEDHVVREALRESEERYRVLFEGSATGILMANVENKQFDYANPSICRMLGYTKEELTRLGIADIHPKDALQLGGRVAWIANHRFALGLVGYGFVNDIQKDYDDDPSSYFLAGGYGGIFFEPILMPNKPVHVSFPIILGVGGISAVESNNWESSHYNYQNTNYYYDSDAFLVFEPGVDVEFNIVKFFRIAIGASYRLTNGINLRYKYLDNNFNEQIIEIDKNALNSFTFNIGFKFGWF